MLIAAAPQPPLRPPHETGVFRKPDLVELRSVIPTLQYDIRYATANNMAGRALYHHPLAFLQRPAAEALKRVEAALRRQGYGLVVFDAYRPWSITKLFWDITPEDQKQFVANPARGSRHNRGCAVDVTLWSLRSHRPIPMPSEFDEPTERSHVDYAGGARRARKMRDLLRAAMEAEGFSVYSAEWWHFDYVDWPHYPLLDLPFSALKPETAHQGNRS